jgi:hypothetical protein
MWSIPIRIAYNSILKSNFITYFPPNVCIPSNEKMTMNNARSNSRPAIDLMLFNKDATRLLSEVQCLKETTE